MKLLAVGLALLLLGVPAAFAGEPGGPGAPNNAPMAASGTWKDTKLVFFTDTTVGVSTSITTEICGIITGTISGKYCDYRNLVVNQASGEGTFSALDICSCNPQTGKPHGGILSREIGTVTFLPPTTEQVLYQAIIQKTFDSTVMNGTINFSGTINPLTLLGNGTYTGSIN